MAAGQESSNTDLKQAEEDVVKLDDDPNSQEMNSFLNKFGKLIPGIFCGLGVICLILFISGLVAQENQIFWGILISCFLLSVLGAWAVYKYGSVTEHIDRLKNENNIYESEIEDLSGTRQKLEGEVKKLHEEVALLQNDASELAKQSEEFADLRKELEDIAGDNADLMELINKTNSIFNDMRATVLENERAYLLNKFYECAFMRDDDGKMNKMEYTRFLARLTEEQREKFKQLGDFEQLAGDDQLIDLDEFQGIIERVLKDVDELIKEQMADH